MWIKPSPLHRIATTNEIAQIRRMTQTASESLKKLGGGEENQELSAGETCVPKMRYASREARCRNRNCSHDGAPYEDRLGLNLSAPGSLSGSATEIHLHLPARDVTSATQDENLSALALDDFYQHWLMKWNHLHSLKNKLIKLSKFLKFFW